MEINSRKIWWARNISRMGERKCAYKILDGELEWENNF
jgi:hypothetical protein